MPEADEKAAAGDDGWDEDVENPKNWSTLWRWAVITLLAVVNFVISISATAFEPALPMMLRDFGSQDERLASLSVSIFVLGYCLGPLVVSPLAELYGRLKVLWMALPLALLLLAGCGASTNFGMFIVFRAFSGFPQIAAATMGTAIAADVLPQERRGLALSVLLSGPSVGPALGPIMGGYLTEYLTWRWTFWVCMIALGVVSAITLSLYRETYAPVLRARTKEARQTSDLAAADSPGEQFKAAWLRPLRMLSSPIVVIATFVTAIANSYLLLALATLGTVFEARYDFSPGQSGLAYLGMAGGFIISQCTLGYISDHAIRREKRRMGAEAGRPEARLPPLLLGTLFLPVGFLWYGWSIDQGTHWIVPILGSALISMGVMYSYLPPMMYLVDCFPVFAASASGASSILRSIITAVVPLGASSLYDRLGYGWGNSLLAFICLCTAPLTILLLRYGENIRTHPKYQPKL